MVEQVNRLSGLDGSKLVASKERSLTNEEVAEMFGSNYRQLIEEKAKQVGIRERLRFFDKPLPHDGSQAMYLAEQYIGGDHLILVPVLGPNMETSRHLHKYPMVREIYHHIAGESFVFVDGKKCLLNKEQFLVEVPLDVIHQVKTQESPALTLIIMENARLVPPGRLHIKDLS